ncbi:alpha/beta hydrolase family protein [Alienimonas sp. DA493]|uniref:alpha/beta hydrolase family protein n=1 Tax=Alienimonas sp. DA493 TaxID=3373605 RepID=UPI0037549498
MSPPVAVPSRFLPKCVALAALGLIATWGAPAGAGEPAEAFSLEDRLAAEDLSYQTDDWHGFTRYTFTAADSDEWIVAPKTPRADRAWVWRARFPGVATELDVELLNRGFHVVYQDVAQDFGGPRAMQRWRGFYEKIRRLGLGERGIFEGLSRGGLPIFAWAAQYPETVAAVLGDNPVCDIRSWPGTDNGATSAACLKAYGVTPETLADFEGSPVGLTDRLAGPRAHGEPPAPVVFVLNGADEVVPPAENAEVMIRKLRAAGGTVKVYWKPGLGHHPHGLQTPEAIDELADWLIEHGTFAAPAGGDGAGDR